MFGFDFKNSKIMSVVNRWLFGHYSLDTDHFLLLLTRDYFTWYTIVTSIEAIFFVMIFGVTITVDGETSHLISRKVLLHEVLHFFFSSF